MKKITLLLVFATTVIISKAQPFLGLYDFAGVTDTTGTIDPSTVPTATGVNFGSFSATGTPANPATGTLGRFNFGSWAIGSTGGAGDTVYSAMTGALADTEYYEVTVGPASGYVLNLDSIKFGFERSSTGVRAYSVRSSLDGFVNNLTANYVFTTLAGTHVFVQPNNVFFLKTDITTPQQRSQIILGGASFSNLMSPVTFRFYAWDSEGAGGTFSIDNVRFIGSASVAIGIKEETQTQVSVFPSPSSNGVFNLDLGNPSTKATVNVYNVIGKTILTKETTASGKQSIDLSTEPNGVYFVNIKTGSINTTKKVVINK